MKKQTQRQRAPRPRNHHRSRPKPHKKPVGGRNAQVSRRDVVSAYLESVAGVSPQQAKALRAAMPRDVPLHTSHWLEAGARRGRKASGLSAAAVAALLGEFLQWCHRQGFVPQHDAAICIAQLELLRRAQGAEPKVIALPAPVGPRELSAEELKNLVTQWESMSYHGALLERGDDENDFALLMAGTTEVSLHLAEVDGVPIRLGHLDPAAFALEVDARGPIDDLGPPPAGYVSLVLDGAAMLYERCAKRSHGRGAIDGEAASQLSAQLRGLAMAYHQGERAA